MSEFDEIFGGGFDAQAEAAAAANETHEFKPIEPGWYRFMIEAPNDGQMVRDARSGGKYLKIVLRGLPNEVCENRLVFWNINLIVKPKDGSQTAAQKANTASQIGRRELARLCVAAGKPMAKDSAELIGCCVQAHIVISKDQNGKPGNDVKEVKPIGAETPKEAPKPSDPAAPSAKASADPNGGKLPWQK